VFAGSWVRLRPYGWRDPGIWLASAAFAVAVGATAAFPTLVRSLELHSPLSHHHVRISILLGLGTAIALIGIQAVALVHRAARQRPPTLKGALAHFLFLRDELQTLLFFLGAIIGAATLATGALRIALIDAGKTTTHDFPAPAVLAYGGYFTLLLVAVYAPAYASLLTLGKRLEDEICGALPEQPEDPAAWSGWLAQRAAVEGFLQLNVSAGDRLKTGLAILAPFVGSAVSLLLGTGM